MQINVISLGEFITDNVKQIITVSKKKKQKNYRNTLGAEEFFGASQFG